MGQLLQDYHACDCHSRHLVIPAKARLQDVGGRAASGTGRRGIQEGSAEGVMVTGFLGGRVGLPFL